jgi:hypothetical protein
MRDDAKREQLNAAMAQAMAAGRGDGSSFGYGSSEGRAFSRGRGGLLIDLLEALF